MVLVQKWPFFQPFFFWQYRSGKCLLRYSRTNKTAFEAIKTSSSKGRKIDYFSKGFTDGFGPKIAIFPTFSLINIGEENVFFDILKWKNCFLGYKKKRSSNSRKFDIFPKGLTHGFGPKKAIFSTFFFTQYRPGKCLLRYSRTIERLSEL